jgi:hypothetical protein
MPLLELIVRNIVRYPQSATSTPTRYTLFITLNISITTQLVCRYLCGKLAIDKRAIYNITKTSFCRYFCYDKRIIEYWVQWWSTSVAEPEIMDRGSVEEFQP